ncbi:MAG: type II toxin-antitoxin system RelE/ParE family toxin [Lautropia sp.]|nr:type II toxin-antitoxin system RelE/ParE family toxin [Lautropia sp.]
MSSLIWSPRATSDIQRLYRFLRPKSQPAAKRAIQAIRNGVKILESQPQLGRPIEEMSASYREWLIDFGDSGYVVLYRLDERNITILAIRHLKEAGY